MILTHPFTCFPQCPSIFCPVTRTAHAMRLIRLDVPAIADYRDGVTLSCSFDMGRTALNSVKWYKDDNEFFRYAPAMRPPITTFPVAGVQLASEPWQTKTIGGSSAAASSKSAITGVGSAAANNNNHNRNNAAMPMATTCNAHVCAIQLRDLRSPQSNGAYRCEISGDAPEFKLVHSTGNMTVAALPRHDPDIGGLAASYSFQSRVTANCTTDRSSPAARISWFLNDVPVSLH